MKQVIEMSEIFGHIELPAGTCEVVATAGAGYDEATHHVTVKLDSVLRKIDLCHREQEFRPDWLPHPQIQTEGVAPEEASEVARDIFKRWVRSVRAALPTSVH